MMRASRMMRAVALLAVVTGCDVVWRVDHFDHATPPNYAYRKRIVVTQPASTALDNYPLAIVRSTDADLALHADPSGGDLVFFDADGNVLDREITQFGPAGELEAWVRLPRLQPGTTELYLAYGGPPIASGPEAVWSTFAGAWHMADATVERDLTGHGHGLVPQTKTPGSGAGVVGAARAFDGATMFCAGAGEPTLDFGTGSFSYSAWVNLIDAVDMYDQPLYKGGASVDDPGYDFELGNDVWHAVVSDTTGKSAEASLDDGVFGSWGYLGAVVDRDQHTFYTYWNGLFDHMVDITAIGSLDSTELLCVGGPHFVHGLVDEIRVFSTHVPDAWFATEFQNFSDPTHFIEFGAEEPTP